MTLKVFAEPSQLKPVSFCPSTVLLSVWIIYNAKRNYRYSRKITPKYKWSWTTTKTTRRVKGLYLYVDLVVCRSMYGAIKSKSNYEYPSVYRKPVNEKEKDQNFQYIHLIIRLFRIDFKWAFAASWFKLLMYTKCVWIVKLKKKVQFLKNIYGINSSSWRSLYVR